MTGIYKITNPIGLVYIGRSIDVHKRYLTHRVGSKLETKLQMSFDLYGFENHKFELIFECDIEDLICYENYFINKYDSISLGLNTKPTVVCGFLNSIEEPIEISVPYYVKTAKENPSRDAGAKPKFGTLKTKKLRIEKVVLESEYETTKTKCNELINRLQSEALDKCSNEALKSREL